MIHGSKFQKLFISWRDKFHFIYSLGASNESYITSAQLFLLVKKVGKYWLTLNYLFPYKAFWKNMEYLLSKAALSVPLWTGFFNLLPFPDNCDLLMALFCLQLLEVCKSRQSSHFFSSICCCPKKAWMGFYSSIVKQQHWEVGHAPCPLCRGSRWLCTPIFYEEKEKPRCQDNERLTGTGRGKS